MTGVRPGSLIHVEFASRDPENTRRFLEKLFGWRFQSMPGLEYDVFAAPTGPGGAVLRASPEQPEGVLDYFLSDNLEEDLAKVERAGGRVRRGKTAIPHVGWWALVEEPAGAVFALFQTQSPERGPVARYRAGP